MGKHQLKQGIYKIKLLRKANTFYQHIPIKTVQRFKIEAGQQLIKIINHSTYELRTYLRPPSLDQIGPYNPLKFIFLGRSKVRVLSGRSFYDAIPNQILIRYLNVSNTTENIVLQRSFDPEDACFIIYLPPPIDSISCDMSLICDILQLNQELEYDQLQYFFIRQSIPTHPQIIKQRFSVALNELFEFKNIQQTTNKTLRLLKAYQY